MGRPGHRGFTPGGAVPRRREGGLGAVPAGERRGAAVRLVWLRQPSPHCGCAAAAVVRRRAAAAAWGSGGGIRVWREGLQHRAALAVSRCPTRALRAVDSSRESNCPSGTRRWLEAGSGENMALALGCPCQPPPLQHGRLILVVL